MITREQFRQWQKDEPLKRLLNEDDLFPTKAIPDRKPPSMEWLETWLKRKRKMRVKSSVAANQDKKKKLPMCYVCLHNPPMGVCLICGYSVATKDIDPHWKQRYDWLKELWAKMRMRRHNSTGIYKLDLEIVKRFGVWRTDIEVFRGYGTLEVIRIEVPIGDSERKAMLAKDDPETRELYEKLLRYYV